MFARNKLFIFLLAYFIIRAFVWFFPPITPLYVGSTVNTIVAAFIAAICGYLIYKNDKRGWLIVAAEILFCGSGNMLSIGSVSLRTILLFVSLAIYFLRSYKDAFNYKRESLIMLALVLWASVSAVIGYIHGHGISNIIADFIPYLFLLYYFPARQLMGDDIFRRNIFNLITASVIAGAIVTIFTSLMFGFGLFHLQDAYYHWFRDVLGGKITDTGANFFRVILNEQLLAIPLVLFFIKRGLEKNEFVNDLILVSTAAILAINLTRIYYLALIVGLLVIFNKTSWRKWLLNSSAVLLCTFAFFTAFHMLVGGAANPGWEYFGLRATSVISPHIEDSSLSRMLLLPEIITKIQMTPIFGSGLGDTVTVWSPVFNKQISTTNFDWGYLEILAETGIIGIIIWLVFLIVIFYLHSKTTIARGKSLLIPSIIALLVINLTSPALFHVFGALSLAVILAYVSSLRSPLPLHNA